MTPRAVRLYLQVANIERAAAFYESLLGVRGERVGPGRHDFWLDGFTLACFDPGAEGEPTGASPLPDYLCLAMENLDAVFARARGGGCQWLDDIEVMPNGERGFTLRDPFGNPIQLIDAATIAPHAPPASPPRS